MLGMLYHIPVQYIHEEFQRVITFSPVALDFDLSLFFNNQFFFEWIEAVPRGYEEVEAQLNKLVYEDDERNRVRSFLEPADTEGYVYISPMAFTLFDQVGKYKEQSLEDPYPPSSGIEDIDKKIAASLREMKHHYPADIVDICRKIAELEYVKHIHGDYFEGTTRTRMRKFHENGVIEMSWADGQKAARLTILTTAIGASQTIKVRDKIKEILEIQ